MQRGRNRMMATVPEAIVLTEPAQHD
jgi:hypothetical protein